MTKYLFEQGRADIFSVRVRNSNLLGAFDHKLMFPTGDGSRIPKASKLANEFFSGDGCNHLDSSFFFEFKGYTFNLRNGISIPYL